MDLPKARKAIRVLEVDDQCETTKGLKHILYGCQRYNPSRVDHPALEYMQPIETVLLKKFEKELKQIVYFLEVNLIHI